MVNQNQLQRFTAGMAVSKPDLVAELQLHYPNAKPTTINWRIHDLLQLGKLIRLGRGKYQVTGDETQPKNQLSPVLANELSELTSALQRQFPYLTICVWSTRTVQPYLMHIPFVDYWLVEVERGAIDVVFAAIQAIIKQLEQTDLVIVKAADWPALESYVADATTVLIVKPLTTEAPLRSVGKLMTTTAEKLIVDLVADDTLFFMYQEELPRIIDGLTTHYVINMDRLRRYARRRNQLSQLTDLVPALNAAA